ncbi:Mrp/NBP35 family ATP-binding protein [Natronolimnobius sp. AArcel1]|uniref:P-loop NTPase n=1 Tax=Natronolimnobius sp. AArcel1 TaxID=1679093 RepID=UPI0013EB1D63|nr:P-loop NTPase [Natronolimnobius sp. AArcel1]NGM70985.1 Mrp/NBP35 family ATP-binding protein [Natronolimnobius sp. AArcel1]
MTADHLLTDDEIRHTVVDRVREVQVVDGDPSSEELLESVDVTDGVVTFTVVFDRLDRLMAERVSEQLRGAGLSTDGVAHVRIEATDADAPASGLPVTGVNSLIAVASSKGGVGKTTITAALARALSEAGLDVGVFDANVHAPDAPDLLEAEGPVHQTPSGRPEPIDADGIEIMSIELIADDGPVAWRGAMVHDVVTDLLGNAAWSDRDILLVDLPPGIGEAVTTIVQQAPLDGALLVSTPTDAGARATERTGALLTANDVPTIGVVANMVGDEGPFAADGTGLQDRINEEAHAAVDPIPFDPSLQTPAACSFADPETDGEVAIDALRATLESFCAEIQTPAYPADAVDLRGLPPSTSQQQAITELGVDGTESVSVSALTRGEPDDLITAVRTSLERDGRELTATTADLGQDGWLVELEATARTQSASESESAT